MQVEMSQLTAYQRQPTERDRRMQALQMEALAYMDRHHVPAEEFSAVFLTIKQRAYREAIEPAFKLAELNARVQPPPPVIVDANGRLSITRRDVQLPKEAQSFIDFWKDYFFREEIALGTIQ